MREILFRGKRNNGDWCFGNLFIPDKKDAPTEICIGTNVIRITYDVIPETVGQYTGLTDKNGKKIFEGDICQIKGISYIDETPFVIEWNNEYCGWFWKDLNFASATDGITQDITKTAKIIGNIHDNHELLKGE